jgi:hypothetical protein
MPRFRVSVAGVSHLCLDPAFQGGGASGSYRGVAPNAPNLGWPMEPLGSSGSAPEVLNILYSSLLSAFEKTSLLGNYRNPIYNR